MASQPDPRADRWLADYLAQAGPDDVLGVAPDPAWSAALHALAAGPGHRGDDDERAPRPVSPMPLLVPEAEWAGVAAGIVQRAELLEAVLADLYGLQMLVADSLSAALIAGSPSFLRPVIGVAPPGGRHLHLIAFDLARGPTGEWRVLADHLSTPAGLGDALANRRATAHAMPRLADRLGIRDHAPFLASLRDGIARRCRRVDPRIALLTADGAEQAPLARALGLPLVEGADLHALNGKLYLRTIAGLKRVDALWRQVPGRALDPLAFDSRSRVGVPGLIDVWVEGGVILANAPGAGLLEAPAFAAFLPALAKRLTGAPLRLPNIATWWCGHPHERELVERGLDELLIAPAFGVAPLGLPGGAMPGAALTGMARAALLADLVRRPQDYVGQEVVRVSTMPAMVGDAPAPRPFTVRVFAARGADDRWTVLPGGVAHISAGTDARAALLGQGEWTADVAVYGPAPAAAFPPSTPDAIRLRRNPGTLPSRAADGLFWLGRYLERAEALLVAVRLLLRHAEGTPATVARLVGLIVGAGAAPPPPGFDPARLAAFTRAALEDERHQSVAMIDAYARRSGEGVGGRLPGAMRRLLAAPGPFTPDGADALAHRYAALAGLTAEHMARTDGWRFLDLGRRIERGMAAARAVRLFGPGNATSDDLSPLLDLTDSRAAYRQLYPTGLARAAAVDLVALDPGNPRALAFQLRAIERLLRTLPVLADDGMAEPQQAEAAALAALVATGEAATLDMDMLIEVERRLAALSDLIARRYFLQGAEPLRAGRLTLA